jgi:hypothetical protein
MALKGDRHEHYTDMSYFMTATAERGIMTTHSGGGSGAAMDQSAALVTIPTGGVSGTYPAGLLLNDVVNYDLTRQHINWHKDEVQSGGKVLLLRNGYVTTNMIATTGTTPAAGLPAYYDVNGKFMASNPVNGTIVGKFLSKKDADGYAKIEINITG